ncbi:phosphatase PAP2 family protein [Arthrobacter sp. GMC3]|uniref:phosphatase PAP2 family protein n=1 Tax=Arthrobacter sp. GMC3 TaxID=2058894 RepID=UPI000CE532C8|nr:phosphatase PAP2 family protein [Arthrobacter sp. GMC3]
MIKHAARSPSGSRTPGRGHIPAAPFMVAAAISLAGLVVTYMFFIKRAAGQFLDESALVEAAVPRRIIGVQSSQVLDSLPATSVVISVIVVLFVTLARRRWKAAGIALAAMAAANLTTQLFKFGLPDRPSLGVTTLTLNSLPSGHSTIAASAAAAVFLVVSPRWRPVAAFAGGSYAVVVGVATVINQWHRPSDVMAAFFVVALWTSLAGLVIVRTGPQWNVWLGASQHWASSRWWVATCSALALVAGIFTVLILRSVAADPSSSTTSYFLAGVGQIVLVGYGLAAAGTLLLTLPVRRRSSR